MAFFEDLYFVGFCDEINFENSKKSPRKHQQGGKLEDSYPMKNSSKIMNRRNVQKNFSFFCLTVLLEGGDKIRSFSLVFCDEIKHPQTVTFLWQIENIFGFFLHFRASGTFLKSLIHFGIIWDIYISKNL
jgi:hypothetical protein